MSVESRLAKLEKMSHHRFKDLSMVKLADYADDEVKLQRGKYDQIYAAVTHPDFAEETRPAIEYSRAELANLAYLVCELAEGPELEYRHAGILLGDMVEAIQQAIA